MSINACYFYINPPTVIWVEWGYKCAVWVSRINAINFRYSSEAFVPCAWKPYRKIPIKISIKNSNWINVTRNKSS
jgi:hypothetical protein